MLGHLPTKSAACCKRGRRWPMGLWNRPVERTDNTDRRLARRKGPPKNCHGTPRYGNFVSDLASIRILSAAMRQSVQTENGCWLIDSCEDAKQP